MTAIDRYPVFDYTTEQLSKYLAASDLYTIMLKNGEIIHFTPKDSAAFEKWLDRNNIPNIRLESDWAVNRKDT